MQIHFNWGTFIFMVINFAILMIVLTRLLYRPIRGILEQRREKIVQDLDDAQKTKDNAERLRREAKIVLEEAHVEAYETVEKARNEAERLREELMAQARLEADQMRQRVHQEIERSKKIAQAELHEEVVNLALLGIQKVIAGNMSKEFDESLIRNILQDIEKTSEG